MGDSAKGTGPLVGVRVVDLTAMVFGPYCTQIMADMGADVIKVEPPDGDPTRYVSVGPAPGMSGVFFNVNRGKRSVVLDLRLDAGKTALRRLIGRADVFIHSMRSKAIAKLGFGYEDVAAINRRHSSETEGLQSIRASLVAVDPVLPEPKYAEACAHADPFRPAKMHAAKRRTLIFDSSLWFADCSKDHSKVALSLLQWDDPLVDLDQDRQKWIWRSGIGQRSDS